MVLRNSYSSIPAYRPLKVNKIKGWNEQNILKGRTKGVKNGIY